MAIIINNPTRQYHTYLYARPPAIAPIILADMLNDKLYGYSDIVDMTGGKGFFDFNTFKPSIYDIINTTTETLIVVLFSQSYSVGPGEIWRFVAHDEIEAHTVINMTPTNPSVNLPYWDTLLGGSFWDNYQSPWDGGRL